jgi:hypothetical protein
VTTAALTSLGAQLLALLIGGFLAVAGGLWLKRHDERRAARAVRVQFVRLLALVRAAIAPFIDDRTASMNLLADPSISYLRERAFSADAALALTERESRLVHDALQQLQRSTDYIDERRRAADPQARRPVLAIIQNFHEIPDAAREAVVQLDAAAAEIQKYV